MHSASSRKHGDIDTSQLLSKSAPEVPLLPMTITVAQPSSTTTLHECIFDQTFCDPGMLLGSADQCIIWNVLLRSRNLSTIFALYLVRMCRRRSDRDKETGLAARMQQSYTL